MARHVVFVNPNKGFGEKYPPLGLICLAAFLESRGFRADIVEANALELTADETEQKILDSGAEYCGLTCMTPQAPYVMDLVRRLKRRQPALRVFAGGVHPSIVPQDFLTRCPEVDALVVGEGEETTLELLETLESGGDPSRLPGTAWLVGGKPVVNAPRPLIRDLDALPLPAWDKLPVDRYEVVTPGRVDAPTAGSGLTISGERGCPFRCEFCASGSVYGRSYRARSARRILEEIESVVRRFGIRNFFFVDEVLTYHERYLRELCEGILQRGLDIRWSCNSRCKAGGLTPASLALMRRAGCRRIDFGVESGSARVLKAIHKDIDVADALRAHRVVHAAGFATTTLMMTGHLEETPEDFRRSLRLVLDVESDIYAFGSSTPFPGTVLYDKAVAGGLLRTPANDWGEFYIGNPLPVLHTKSFSSAEISRLTDYANSVGELVGRLARRKRHGTEPVAFLFARLLADVRSRLPFRHRAEWIAMFILKGAFSARVDEMLNRLPVRVRRVDSDTRRPFAERIGELAAAVGARPARVLLVCGKFEAYVAEAVQNLCRGLDRPPELFVRGMDAGLLRRRLPSLTVADGPVSGRFDAVLYCQRNILAPKHLRVLLGMGWSIPASYFSLGRPRQFLINAALHSWDFGAGTLFKILAGWAGEAAGLLLLPLVLARLLYWAWRFGGMKPAAAPESAAVLEKDAVPGGGVEEPPGQAS